MDFPTAIGIPLMVSGKDSGGGFALVEHPMLPGALAAPLHRHHEDEYSVVLEGRMGALLGDEVADGNVGDLIFFKMKVKLHPAERSWVLTLS
jgi:mannose-6-phosphate isomerase-like protein (cupin superfamily)